MRIRGFLYGLGMKHCGKRLDIQHNVRIVDLEGLSIGDDCGIANGCVLIAYGGINIGYGVRIGPHAVIVAGDHTSKNGSFKFGKGKHEPIHIEDGCWIAGNCTIGKGTRLPKGSILSANSFLNKKMSEESYLYGGVPAKAIKRIDNA